MALSARDCVAAQALLGEGAVWWSGARWFTDFKQQKILFRQNVFPS